MAETNENIVLSGIEQLGSTLEELNALNPILRNNEICIVEIPNTETPDAESVFMIKVGNGIDNFKALPYISGLGDSSKASVEYVDNLVNNNISTASAYYTYSIVLGEEVDPETLDYTKSPVEYTTSTKLTSVLADGYQYLIMVNTDQGQQNFIFTYFAPAKGGTVTYGDNDTTLKITITDDAVGKIYINNPNVTEITKVNIYFICSSKSYIDSYLELSADALNRLINEFDFTDECSLVLGPVNIEGSNTYNVESLGYNFTLAEVVADAPYQILFDGISYSIKTAAASETNSTIVLGNPNLLDSEAPTNNLPFCFNGTTLLTETADFHTIAVYSIGASEA